MKLPSLDSLFRKATATFKRFPLAITAAAIGSLFCVLLTHSPYDLIKSHYYYWNIIRSCYLAMMLFIAVNIYIERINVNKRTAILISLAGIALIAGYYFSLPGEFMTISFTRFVLFTIALHLLIAFVPFLSRGEVNGFWQYNKILFLRILTAALYTGVLYLGLSLALLAVDKLFNADIDGKIYVDLWVLLGGIFNTWFFLSGLPAKFTEAGLPNDYPKGLKIFTQYVLLPLVSVYLIILYAYMFKIIINAQWPVGWVSYLVIGFSTGGILSLLLIYPVRNDENNKWILIFSRFFYFALFPLIILLFFAIKRRIHDYGITEQRYFILVLALWLLFIALYFLFSRAKNIKLIPISLCILALTASFGPWGAFSVSLANQKQHLKSLLEKYALLKDGKIIKAKDTIPFKDHKQISSIINYLVDVHGYKTLQPYFVQNLDSAFKSDELHDNRYDYTKVNTIHSLMNITYIADYEREEAEDRHQYLNYYSNKADNIINIKGYDYFISDFNINDYIKHDTACQSYLSGGSNISVCFDFNKKRLTITNSNEKDSALSIELSPLLISLEKKGANNNPFPASDMTLTSANPSLSAKIIFDAIHFQKQNDSMNQLGFNANIFIWKR